MSGIKLRLPRNHKIHVLSNLFEVMDAHKGLRLTLVFAQCNEHGM